MNNIFPFVFISYLVPRLDAINAKFPPINSPSHCPLTTVYIGSSLGFSNLVTSWFNAFIKEF